MAIHLNQTNNFLKLELNKINPNEFDNGNECETDNEQDSSLYVNILSNFMKSVFEGTYKDVLSKIVGDIINAGKKISVSLFDDLDKDTALNIYAFLSNNRSVLHLSQEIMDIIRDIVVKKYNNVEVYKLNPSINDLLNNNVYKLYVNEELFLVPLWHNESYFDSSGCEIIVICEPELPNNITIDDDNNIHFETVIHDELLDLREKILHNDTININIGDNVHKIPLANLYMKREQYYRIKNAGLSKIKKDIYDVSEKTDIIVKISIS